MPCRGQRPIPESRPLVAERFAAGGPAPSGGPIGRATERIDGPLKVSGAALYAADHPQQNPAYGTLVTSVVAKGRIVSIDTAAVARMPGVIAILTHENVGDAIKPGAAIRQGGFMGSSIQALRDDRVHHAGQIVALIVAESGEIARDAARHLAISYEEEPASATIGDPGTEERLLADAFAGRFRDSAIGDAGAAFAAAPFRIDRHYSTPIQHHNGMELFATTCAWDGDKLTIWEGSQHVRGMKFGVAEQLGIDPADVRAIALFTGGGFGGRGPLTCATALTALAARRVDRPVKLEASRAQGFTIATYRAETRQRVRLGADADGRLMSLSHEGWELTSRADVNVVVGTHATTRLYACPNISSTVSIVHADRNTPGSMRAPPEVPYLFALECAMDELAEALAIDPVELRRRNDTVVDPVGGLHYTSRGLLRSFDAGAEAFGWSRRDPRPGAMRDGDWLIGMGCASAMFPSVTGPATVRLTIDQQARVRVQAGIHDPGTGAYTMLAIIAADLLGLEVDAITVELGDSVLPPAPAAGGSNTTASMSIVLGDACEQVRARLAAQAVLDAHGAFHGLAPESLCLAGGRLTGPDGRQEPLTRALARISNGPLEVQARTLPHGSPADGLERLDNGYLVLGGGLWLGDRLHCSFGAQFVEVRINAATGEIRVSRMLGAFAAGRIVNPLAARGQLSGGMIWGMSSALLEATEIARSGRYVNTNLEEYLLPVCADIGEIEVLMLPEEDDRVNAMGVKGIGELGICGVNAAIANAVYNAVGVRVRDLPIRIEDMLAALDPLAPHPENP